MPSDQPHIVRAGMTYLLKPVWLQRRKYTNAVVRSMSPTTAHVNPTFSDKGDCHSWDYVVEQRKEVLITVTTRDRSRSKVTPETLLFRSTKSIVSASHVVSTDTYSRFDTCDFKSSSEQYAWKLCNGVPKENATCFVTSWVDVYWETVTCHAPREAIAIAPYKISILKGVTGQMDLPLIYRRIYNWVLLGTNVVQACKMDE